MEVDIWLASGPADCAVEPPNVPLFNSVRKILRWRRSCEEESAFELCTQTPVLHMYNVTLLTCRESDYWHMRFCLKKCGEKNDAKRLQTPITNECSIELARRPHGMLG